MLCRHLSGESEESQEYLSQDGRSSGPDLNPGPPQYEAGVLTCGPPSWVLARSKRFGCGPGDETARVLTADCCVVLSGPESAADVSDAVVTSLPVDGDTGQYFYPLFYMV
jgi:hypothetical protein